MFGTVTVPCRIGLVALAVGVAACLSVRTPPDQREEPSPAPPPSSPTEGIPEVRAETEVLAELGILRFRYTSELVIPAGVPYVSVYRGAVEVEDGHTYLDADGFSGDFEVYLTDTATWYRYPEGEWRRLDRPAWRFSPAGPIPHYSAAGVIAHLAARRDAEVVAVGELSGRRVHHVVRRLPDTTIEFWVTDDGVVLQERIVQEVPGGEVVSTWQMLDINGAFDLTPPDHT
jgi:hypothetical protein